MRPRLRLYLGDDESETTAESRLTLRLSELAPILFDAVDADRGWLRDLRHDEIAVSNELYDIVCAYWDLRPSA